MYESWRHAEWETGADTTVRTAKMVQGHSDRSETLRQNSETKRLVWAPA